MNDCVIKLSDVCVFRDGKEILHGINLDIPQGRHTFILGPNGSGKTTFVKLLLGHLYPAYGGDVEVLGRRFGESDIREMRRHIGAASPLLNEFGFTGTTVKDIILSGFDSSIGLFREPSDEEILIANQEMEKFSIRTLADRTYNTLSSGEQIRVLIARALINSPELLILDEPCVFLDPAGREKLLEELDVLSANNQNLTIIYITQRTEDITPLFQYGILLSQGKIFAEGKTEFLLDENKLSTVFQTPLQLVKGKNGRSWSICK